MIVLFIITVALSFTVVFLVGFWAGRLTERTKWNKQQRVEAKKLIDDEDVSKEVDKEIKAEKEDP